MATAAATATASLAAGRAYNSRTRKQGETESRRCRPKQSGRWVRHEHANEIRNILPKVAETLTQGLRLVGNVPRPYGRDRPFERPLNSSA